MHILSSTSFHLVICQIYKSPLYFLLFVPSTLSNFLFAFTHTSYLSCHNIRLCQSCHPHLIPPYFHSYCFSLPNLPLFLCLSCHPFVASFLLSVIKLLPLESPLPSLSSTPRLPDLFATLTRTTPLSKSNVSYHHTKQTPSNSTSWHICTLLLLTEEKAASV